MTDRKPSPGNDREAARAERLARALRENLRRRKAQQRARRSRQATPAPQDGRQEQD